MFKNKRLVPTVSLALILLCVLSGVFIAPCSLFKPAPVSIRPLAIPGAEYVGMDTCISCHEDEHKYFQLSEHASVTIALSEEEQEQGGVRLSRSHSSP